MVDVHPEISLNSTLGLSSPKTMMLWAIIKGREVVIMIDLSMVAELCILMDDLEGSESRSEMEKLLGAKQGVERWAYNCMKK